MTPIPQTPTTSAHTTSSPVMTTSDTTGISTTSITSPISTPSTTHHNFNAVPTVPREAHRSHTVFAPITLVESLKN